MSHYIVWHENRAYPIMRLQGVLFSVIVSTFMIYFFCHSDTKAGIFLFSILGSTAIIGTIIGSIRELLTVPVRVGLNQNQIFLAYRKLAVKKEFYTECFEIDRIKEVEISKRNAPWKTVYVFFNHTDIKKRHRGEVKSVRDGTEKIRLGLFHRELAEILNEYIEESKSSIVADRELGEVK